MQEDSLGASLLFSVWNSMGTAFSSNIQYVLGFLRSYQMFTVTYRLDSSNHPRILYCPTFIYVPVYKKKKNSVDSSLFWILELVEIWIAVNYCVHVS